MRRIALVAAAVLLASCGATEDRSRDADSTAAERGAQQPGGRVLERYGIRAELPHAWDGELRRAALHAANFDLAELTPGAPLRGDGVLVQLFETDRDHDSPPTELSLFPELDAAPALAASDFRPPEPGTFQAGAYARRTFALAGRPFVLFVASGERQPAPDTIAGVNRLLASVDVAPGDFYPGTVEPARFEPRPGWHVGDTGPRPVLADSDWVTAWAATIPYADAWNALPPQETLRRLPDDGIVIWLSVERNNRFPPTAVSDEGGFPPVEPPFRLGDFERHAGWEGQIGEIPEYRLWGTVRRTYRVEIRVFFGRAQPTPAMLADAQATLDGMRLPEWGPWELEG